MSAEPAASVAAASIAAGVSAITVAMLGVEPQTVLYAALGSALGIVGTQPMTRARNVWVFVATVLIGALAATAAARHWFGGDVLLRNLIAVIAAPLYPVVRDRIANRAPSLLDKALDKIDGGPK